MEGTLQTWKVLGKRIEDNKPETAVMSRMNWHMEKLQMLWSKLLESKLLYTGMLEGHSVWTADVHDIVNSDLSKPKIT